MTASTSSQRRSAEALKRSYRPWLGPRASIPIPPFTVCPWALLNHQMWEYLFTPAFSSPLKPKNEFCGGWLGCQCLLLCSSGLAPAASGQFYRLTTLLPVKYLNIQELFGLTISFSKESLLCVSSWLRAISLTLLQRTAFQGCLLLPVVQHIGQLRRYCWRAPLLTAYRAADERWVGR